jgi:hypothetical protein
MRPFPFCIPGQNFVWISDFCNATHVLHALLTHPLISFNFVIQQRYQHREYVASVRLHTHTHKIVCCWAETRKCCLCYLIIYLHGLSMNCTATCASAARVICRDVDVFKKSILIIRANRLCGLVVRVPGYRFRGPGLDCRRYQIF